ncbi:class I SAM-dependent methyltransferase [Agromyces binzhouensis]|uniref:class I SAM-dependent methyltransferase n=1 Tax=Agromyces binzhouensis TaxID=1817495 RepID=UPI00363FF1B4
MRIDRRSIHVDLGDHEGPRTIDVLFDGRRVWSARVAPDAGGRIAWPNALKPYLRGRTMITLRDAADDEVIASREVTFPGSTDRIRLADSMGRPLAMNKWDRLGPVFDGGEASLRDRLLKHSAEIVRVVQDAGFSVYIVGGSLLGYMRSGGLLPHDDDVDLAFLSEHSDPSDIALDSYRMERVLRVAGYTVVRHSLAHLEIDFFDDRGHVEHYVDVFTGYFRDGLYHQPFALRGPEVVREDLLPVVDVDVDGVALPAPARPEAWLEYAYGPNWRIPDPSFKFETSQWTRRRFENSFGVFNRARVYWEKRYLALDSIRQAEPAGGGLDRFLDALPAGANVLDLGCGTGEATNRIAAAGHSVLGIDFSHEALSIASANAVAGARFAYANLNDRHDLFGLGAQLLATGEVWHVRIADLVHGLTQVNRENVFLFLQLVLRGEGFASGSVPTNLPKGYQRGNPTSWHYPRDWIEQEIGPFPLRVEFGHEHVIRTDLGNRTIQEFIIVADASARVVEGEQQ